MAPVLTAINPNLGLVVRGPSPGGIAGGQRSRTDGACADRDQPQPGSGGAGALPGGDCGRPEVADRAVVPQIQALSIWRGFFQRARPVLSSAASLSDCAVVPQIQALSIWRGFFQRARPVLSSAASLSDCAPRLSRAQQIQFASYPAGVSVRKRGCRSRTGSGPRLSRAQQIQFASYPAGVSVRKRGCRSRTGSGPRNQPDDLGNARLRKRYRCRAGMSSTGRPWASHGTNPTIWGMPGSGSATAVAPGCPVRVGRGRRTGPLSPTAHRAKRTGHTRQWIPNVLTSDPKVDGTTVTNRSPRQKDRAHPAMDSQRVDIRPKGRRDQPRLRAPLPSPPTSAVTAESVT